MYNTFCRDCKKFNECWGTSEARIALGKKSLACACKYDPVVPDVVYFAMINWEPGVHHPDAEPFKSWMLHNKFMDEDWVKENKLCIICEFVDMAISFRVAASGKWVLENCPDLLTFHDRFLVKPDEDGSVVGLFGEDFPEYKESNFGVSVIYD